MPIKGKGKGRLSFLLRAEVSKCFFIYLVKIFENSGGVMKTIPFYLMILCGAVAPLTVAPMAHAQLGERTKKEAITCPVLQVLPKGLLMSGSDGSPFLLAGHPDAGKLADGDAVNCYAVKTSHTYKYTDTLGAERTVRVWKYMNRRMGK